MSLLNLQLNNFYEIYNRLHKLYLSNKDVIDIKKYFDSDTGRVAIFLNYLIKAIINGLIMILVILLSYLILIKCMMISEIRLTLRFTS